MGRGKADKSAYAKARPYFIKARHLDELDPRPAIGYYLSFREAGEAVPAAAVTALEQVYPEASFDPQYRLPMTRQLDRKTAVEGKRVSVLVDFGGRRSL